MKLSIIIRTLVLATVLAVALAFGAMAQQLEEKPVGPVQPAAETWFKTNMPGMAIEGIGTFYSPVGEWVVVVFNSTSGGNLVQTDITVFQRQADGGYRFLKTATPPKGAGEGVVKVEYRTDGATITSPVWRKTDPRCCPSGKQNWQISLP